MKSTFVPGETEKQVSQLHMGLGCWPLIRCWQKLGKVVGGDFLGYNITLCQIYFETTLEISLQHHMW